MSDVSIRLHNKKTWWQILFRKKSRLKVEFFPALINIFVTGLLLGIVIPNSDYRKLINDILISQFGGFQTDYFIIITVVLGVIALHSIILLILGMIRLNWIHQPILNVLSPFFLTLIVIVMGGILKINQRVGLDYIFFFLGPIKSEIVYIIVSSGIFCGSGVLFSAIIRLYNFSGPSDRKWVENGPHFHFKLAAITSAISIALFIPILALILFYYALTRAYWNNIIKFFALFVNWSDISLIIWGSAVVMTILLLIGSYYIRKHGKLTLSKFNKFLHFSIISSLILQIIGIIWSTINLSPNSGISIPILSWILVCGQLLILIGTSYPVLIPRIFQSDGTKRMKITFIIGLLLIPYWFIFYQPLVFGPMGVDLPPSTRLITINGVDVPFQGNTAYPSFEWQSPDVRQYINLSGEWKYWQGTGSDPNSLSPRSPTVLQKLTQGQHSPEFDDSDWLTVQVPHAMTLYGDSPHYWGIGWYRRLVEIPSNFTDKDLILKFYGVNYLMDLWIDGQYIGYHEGFFTSFAFDVSNSLTPGTHLLAIRVDNPEWGSDVNFRTRIVPEGCDFFNYGGIEREIWLEAISRPSIVRIDMHQGNYTTWDHLIGSQTITLDVILKINPILSECTLSIGIFPINFIDQASLMSRNTWEYIQWSENVTQILTQNINLQDISKTGYLSYQIPMYLPNIRFWSTKHPYLYAIVVNVSVIGLEDTDSFCTQVGFRHIDVDQSHLLLNGAFLKLAGCSVHEQYPDPIGRCLDDQMRYTDLSLIQNLSANWWRGSYPFHPLSYIYSDRLGLACWEEAPIFWVNEINIVQANSRKYYQSLWIEILYRDYNRPSILFWGACNEPWATTALYQYLKDTRTFLDKHDPGRILSFACVSSHHWSPGFQYLRVCTPNTYAGTFEGVRGDWYSELTQQIWRFANNSYNKDKPMVSMEFGYWRGGVNDSEQLRCFTECFQAFSEHPMVQGMTWWVAFDYFGVDYYNSMGIFNHARTWCAPIRDVMEQCYSNYTKENL